MNFIEKSLEWSDTTSSNQVIYSKTENKKTASTFKTNGVIDAIRDNYASLVTQSEVLLIILDKALNIKFISSSICDLLHHTADSLIDESIFSMITPDNQQDIHTAIGVIRDFPNKTHRLEALSLYCTMGYQHFFDGVVINLQEDERIGGYLFYLHNVTAHRKIEAQLKDLNLELDSFVYKASHDLRAPLASLSGLIYLTESDFQPEAKENFDMMKTSVLKLDKFIQQLAHYSRNNNTEEDYTKIHFRNLIEEVIDGYKHLENTDKIHFEIAINTKQVIISDAFRLKVILGNLISNAIKYHQIKQDFPFIKISVEVCTKAFSITIQDNGIGIHEQYLDKIFNMFVRATNYSDGSGLGLYIVKKALEKLRGEIKVDSKRDEGSIFEIIIPNHISKKRG